VEDQQLNPRDGLGISETAKVGIRADENADILAIEIPMWE